MDFAELSRWLAQRGVEVWSVDGPGQGESRFSHGHYLHKHWREAFRELISYIKVRTHGLPVGIVGSSVGGTLAFEIAASEPRIGLCCSNGGPMSGSTILGQQEAKVPKKRMMCGPHVDAATADEIWSSIDVSKIGSRVTCQVLVIHGNRDPLISDDEMQRLFSSLASLDKQMIMFSDGDHCIYNHADDKYVAIADWVTKGLRKLNHQAASTALST
jgi:alpha-beta hydrolase superfamily lysophospholipase